MGQISNDCPVLEHSYCLALSTCLSMELEPLCPCIWLMYLTCWHCIHYPAYSTLRWYSTIVRRQCFLQLFKACIAPINYMQLATYHACCACVYEVYYIQFFCNYTTSIWSKLVHTVHYACMCTLKSTTYVQLPTL